MADIKIKDETESGFAIKDMNFLRALASEGAKGSIPLIGGHWIENTYKMLGELMAKWQQDYAGGDFTYECNRLANALEKALLDFWCSTGDK